MIAQNLRHFIDRFVAVEKKIKKPSKQFAFVYRWIRYAVHHYHLIPTWAKVMKLVLIIAIIFSQQIRDELRTYKQQDQLYHQLYSSYYEHYRKETTDELAKSHADYYARHYAQYYTSPAYTEALRYALPETKKAEKVIKQAERKALPEVRGLSIAPIGLQLIKHLEGLRLTPYKDAGGKYTIGYGHLMRKGERFTKISEAEATTILIEDIRLAEAIVKEYVRVPINRYQFSALVSLVFNIGGHQFKKSTLLKKLNRADYYGASAEFRRWNKVGKIENDGLTRRRTMERKLFTGEWKARG